MIPSRFARDRYDPTRLAAAFKKAQLVTSQTEIYAQLDYDEIEIYFPECQTLPLPVELGDMAERACKSIRVLDNLVQDSCEREAERSEYDDRNFKLHVAYLKVFASRLHIRYWGEIVNTEWEAEFVWDAADNNWKPANF